MKQFAKINKILKKSLDNKISLMIYSILLSIAIWFIVSINVYPTTPMTLEGVSVLPTDLTGTLAAQNNLSVITQPTEKVTVQIQGDRTQVGNVKPEDLAAKVIVENVSKSGEYTLKLSLENNSGIEFDVLKIVPGYVTVSFDEIVEKTFDVTAVINKNDIKLSDGDMIFGDVIVSPPTVRVKGPLKQLSEIERCSVRLSENGTYSDSFTTHTSNLEFYSANDFVITQTPNVTADVRDFTVDVPILIKKTLNFDFELRNVPSYMNSADLKSKFKLSSQQITIAAPRNAIDSFSSNLGYIDLRNVDLSFSKTFSVDLPGSFSNISNIKSVTAIFDGANYAKETFTIKSSDFSILPKSLLTYSNVKVETDNLRLEVVGPREEILKLKENPDNLIIEVDLTGEPIVNASFDKPIKTIIEDCTKCWVLNSNVSVILTISEKK